MCLNAFACDVEAVSAAIAGPRMMSQRDGPWTGISCKHLKNCTACALLLLWLNIVIRQGRWFSPAVPRGANTALLWHYSIGEPEWDGYVLLIGFQCLLGCSLNGMFQRPSQAAGDLRSASSLVTCQHVKLDLSNLNTKMIPAGRRAAVLQSRRRSH